MQLECPSCSQRVVVDDAKAPDRPFAVKCPKCQGVVRFPGRAPATPSPTAATPAGAPEATPPADAEAIGRLQRQIRGRQVGPGPGQVLVALNDPSLARAITAPLGKIGYDIDTLDRPEEGGRLLEEGFYEVVVTNKAASVPGKGESLYQRLIRLPPDARRTVFLVLVGDEFKTGDGTQAWVAQADLVIGRDGADIESLLLNTMAERTRLFQVFLDARRRFEEAAG
ncbi:MAG TPA: zinc-ribbon domain-containing protein [Vicinamibacteria bacterium]|nr:zinc-ribbon domain-containing protein [Vicinamibacteria bacterium]